MKAQTVSDLIEQHEVPKEYVDVVFEAYELGAKKYMELMTKNLMNKSIMEQIKAGSNTL